MAKRKRTPEEEHNLLYSRYVSLNVFKNRKMRTPSSGSKRTDVERRYDNLTKQIGLQDDSEVKKRLLLKALDASTDIKTDADKQMFLQGTCTNAEPEEKAKAFSIDRGERQEFIDNNCSTCPIKDGCLNFALEHSDSNGVWGGTHPEQRAGYNSQLREGLINPLDTHWFPEYKEP